MKLFRARKSMQTNQLRLNFGVALVWIVGACAVSCTSDDGDAQSGGCGPGTVDCGGVCTSTAVDPGNCGACGNACGAGEACDNGTCALECSGGTTMCGQSCVDTQNDPAHCGGCDNACDAAQEACFAGQCGATCGDSGLLRCGDSCVDPMSDAAHCGGCDSPCAGTDACVSGQCAVQAAPKGVYTMTNDPSGNAILAFQRAADGSLSPSGTFTPTGGRGTGGGLGNQRGMIYDPAQNLFFVVNAGDHTISMLSLTLDGALELRANVPSGGERPVSVTVHGGTVYVLNAGVVANGTSGNISGFKVMGTNLVPIANSTRPLSEANPNPAQIQFSPDGTVLAVTERATNVIDTYTVAADIATGPTVTPSAGETPFGFDFSANGHLIVSEAWGGQPNLSSASSYSLGMMGALTPVVSALPTTRTAACWLVVAGDYAYMANAQTNDVTGFQVAADGTLTMLDPDGVTGQAGMGPVDEDVTDDNDFLYVINNGSDSFSIFQINVDGSLTKQPDFMGLPATATGIIAR
jgi:6-phosphogluconolactonase (cycloisomerase 2 family)